MLNRFRDDATEEMEYGTMLIEDGTRDNVVIDVATETICDIGSEPQTITFCGESDELENVLRGAYNYFSSNFTSVFGTVAIHEYDSYRNITPAYTIDDPATQCGGDTYKFRALYTWQMEVVESSNAQDFLTFCQNYCINKIYLESQTLTSDSSYHGTLARFLNDSFAYGIEVELVLGYALWTKEEYHSDCLKYVDNVVEFVASLALPDNDDSDDSSDSDDSDDSGGEDSSLFGLSWLSDTMVLVISSAIILVLLLFIGTIIMSICKKKQKSRKNSSQAQVMIRAGPGKAKNSDGTNSNKNGTSAGAGVHNLDVENIDTRKVPHAKVELGRVASNSANINMVENQEEDILAEELYPQSGSGGSNGELIELNNNGVMMPAPVAPIALQTVMIQNADGTVTQAVAPAALVMPVGPPVKMNVNNINDNNVQGTGPALPENELGDLGSKGENNSGGGDDEGSSDDEGEGFYGQTTQGATDLGAAKTSNITVGGDTAGGDINPPNNFGDDYDL